MEIIRYIVRMARNQKAENPQSAQIPQKVYPYFQKGEKLARSIRLADLLSLEGNDATLLYLLCAQKVLYEQIERDADIFYGQNAYTREIFPISKDSTKNIKQRSDAQILEDSINGFLQEHYSISDINRAWALRNAVNILFSQTRYIDQKTGRTSRRWNSETIKEWSEKWKPQIKGEL